MSHTAPEALPHAEELDCAITSCSIETEIQSVAAPAIFTPLDIEAFGKAFVGAVTIASDEVGPFADIPVHELRRRLAQAIVEAAVGGVRDVNLLRAYALRTVAVRIAKIIVQGRDASSIETM